MKKEEVYNKNMTAFLATVFGLQASNQIISFSVVSYNLRTRNQSNYN
jgi:hypothetical protein